MTVIYIDESGDLGMSLKGSKYFILTAVKIEDEETNTNYKRVVKDIRQRKLKKKMKELAELKFSNSSPLIREIFLKKIAKLNLQIYCLIIKKQYTSQRLKDNLPVLYNYLIKVLLEKPLADIAKNSELRICLDKCMSVSQIENFENYIKTEFLSLFSEIPNLHITHESSRNEMGLQVTDFVSGAFGYKYNTAQLAIECERYTSIIKDKIVIEKSDFFKETATPAYLS